MSVKKPNNRPVPKPAQKKPAVAAVAAPQPVPSSDAAAESTLLPVRAAETPDHAAGAMEIPLNPQERAGVVDGTGNGMAADDEDPTLAETAAVDPVTASDGEDLAPGEASEAEAHEAAGGDSSPVEPEAVAAPAADVLSALVPTVIPTHPAADLFPLLPDDQLAELAEDIRVRGQVEPVVTIVGDDGIERILDGRNRARACALVGVAPHTVRWDGSGGTPVGFVLSKNIHRRNLTPSQRAAIAVDLLPLLEAEAKERQVAAAEATNAARLAEPETAGETVPAILPEASPVPSGGEAREVAAGLVGASPRYVSDAKALAEKAPDVLDAVKAGTVTIPEGKRIAALPEAERRDALSEAKSGKPSRTKPAAKPVIDAAEVDVLGPVKQAVAALARTLDAMPKATRPIWWKPLRAAVRGVGA